MSSDDSVIQQLLQNNAEWAKAVENAKPDFFVQSAQGQSPQVSLSFVSFLFFVFLVVVF